jgi:hypothetical protein
MKQQDWRRMKKREVMGEYYGKEEKRGRTIV